MKRRRHQPIRFLFIHLCHVSCGDAGIAIGTKYRAVMLRKVQNAVNDTFVVHLHEVTFTHLLVVGDEGFTMSARDRQNMAATDFFAIWVWVYGYGGHPLFKRIRPLFWRIFHSSIHLQSGQAVAEYSKSLCLNQDSLLRWNYRPCDNYYLIKRLH